MSPGAALLTVLAGLVLAGVAYVAGFTRGRRAGRRTVRVGEAVANEIEGAVRRIVGGRCPIASERTQGRYACTREPGHEGPCAAVLQPRPPHKSLHQEER